MSAGGPVGRREVAVRCFAAEYDDASLEFSESDEERAPNYVVTPTGARVNRLFVVGVLTEVEQVSDGVLRARVVDPTGAFVVYAGQYQPDAKTALERAEPPAFVAVTGKARTFEPDDGDRVYTSIRPESVNVVDADTRDRWTVQTADQTLDRVSTFAAALDREERGNALTEALLASGVDPALASGIPRAIAHYGTTEAYLAAVRELALQATGVVAGEREEVESLDLAPGEGGTVEVDLAAGVTIEAAATPPVGESSGGTATSTDAEAASSGEPEPAAADEPAESGTSAGSDATPAEPAGDTATDAGASEATDSTDDSLGDFDDYGSDADASGADAATSSSEGASTGDDAVETAAAESAGGDELYEMDEEERAAVEEEFGTEFSTGNEVDEPGEADIETPGPEDESVDDEDEVATEEQTESSADTTETTDASAVDEADDGEEAEAGDEDEAAAEGVGLVDAVVAAMGELDDGAGAERAAVVESVVADHGVDEAAVEDAIQDALMGGRCYEPDDEHIKAI